MPKEGKLMPANVEVTEGEIGTAGNEVTSAMRMVEDGLKILFGSLGSRLPTKTIEVEAGDTLWTLAERELGDGQRWREIYLLNLSAVSGDEASPEPNPDLIHPGTELKLLDF